MKLTARHLVVCLDALNAAAALCRNLCIATTYNAETYDGVIKDIGALLGGVELSVDKEIEK